MILYPLQSVHFLAYYNIVNPTMVNVYPRLEHFRFYLKDSIWRKKNIVFDV